MNRRICVFLFVLLPLTAVWSEQTWNEVGPYGGYIRSLATDGNGDIYAGTYLGGICKSVDGGMTWLQLYTDTLKTDFRSVAINAKGYIFGGTDGFGIQRSTDGGTTWERLPGFLVNSTVRAMLILSNDNIIAGSTDGVFHSTDDGTTFTYISTGLTNTSISALAETDSGYLFAATQGAGVFRSVNGGALWAPSSTGMNQNDLDIYGLAVKNGNELWAAAGRQLYRSIDFGNNWTSVLPTAVASYSGIAIAPNGSIYTAATSINNAIGGGVFKTTDAGVSWTPQVGLPNIPHFAVLVSASYVATGTEGPGVYHATVTAAAQDTWSLGAVGMTNTHITGIDQGDDSTFYACTRYAGMFASKDAGTTWQNFSSGLPHAWLNGVAVNPVSGDLFTATASITYRSIDHAESWQQTRTSGASTLKCNGLGIIYSGLGGSVSRSTNGGTTWTSTFLNGVNNIADFAFDEDTVYVATGNINGTTGQGVFRSIDLGLTYNAYNEGLTNLNVTTVSVRPAGQGGDQCPRVTAGTKGNGEFALNQTTGQWGSSGLEGTTIAGIKDRLPATNLVHLGVGLAFLYARDATCLNKVFALLPGFEPSGFLAIYTLPGSQPFNKPVSDFGVLVGTNGHGVLRGTPVISSVSAQPPDVPLVARLEQNYPNPFNPTTTIEYSVGGISNVRLVIYDILGREVATLVNEKKEPGAYSVAWDASGKTSGVYICQLKVGGYIASEKMLLIR